MPMKLCFRKILGRLVAVSYSLFGARHRALAQYDKEDSVLSIFGHEARLDVLEPIIRYLVRRGFSFVSTDDLILMKMGKKDWRPRLAWLTYDDGWKGLANLLPVLEKYHVPVTVFISPAETDRGQAWSKHVRVGQFAQGDRTLFDFAASERYGLIDSVAGMNLYDHELADWKELEQFAKHPLVTIENHTNSHLSCSHRPLNEVIAEIMDANTRLKEMGLSKGRLVCYPFGHRTDDTDKWILESGMVPVRSDAGVMTVRQMGMHRNAFHQNVSFQENIGRILGAWPGSRLAYD